MKRTIAYQSSFRVRLFSQSTETFVVMSRSTNVDASELEESLVLYCYTRKLKREVRGAFATVDKLLAEDKAGFLLFLLFFFSPLTGFSYY